MRSRARAAVLARLGPDWVKPHWLERDADSDLKTRNWTTIGTVASRAHAIVDPRGLVAPADGWSLDWWVGAEDRWHFPSRETAVRQSLVDHTPIVETALRVPGGDVVQRVYAVPSDEPLGSAPGQNAVVEITNRTPVPVALALAVRPFDPAGFGAVHRIELAGRTVFVDGRRAVLFAKRPQYAAASTLVGGDVATVVASGAAGEVMPDAVRCPSGLAQAAFLFPLAHGATLRVALPLTTRRHWLRRTRTGRRSASADSDAPVEVPPSEAAVRGWKAHADRGMRLVLPAGRIASAVEANRQFLMLFDPRDHPLASARYGFSALDPRAAARPKTGTRRTPDNGAQQSELDRLRRLVDHATDTYTWSGPAGGHDMTMAADFLLSARDLLVRETADGLAMLSDLPPEWTGQPIEVHDAPTNQGLLSYAVRWHGDRPGVLWELRPSGSRATPPRPTRLTIPGLDPAWSTVEPRGDALLPAVAHTSGTFT